MSIFVQLSFAQHDDEPSKGLRLIQRDFETGKLSFEETLLQKFYYGFDKSNLDRKYYFEDDKPGKCGTELIQQFYQNKKSLSQEIIKLNLAVHPPQI